MSFIVAFFIHFCHFSLFLVLFFPPLYFTCSLSPSFLLDPFLYHHSANPPFLLHVVHAFTLFPSPQYLSILKTIKATCSLEHWLLHFMSISLLLPVLLVDEWGGESTCCFSAALCSQSFKEGRASHPGHPRHSPINYFISWGSVQAPE